MRIRDPGWRLFGSGIRDGKKSDPGSGINVPDPQHCSDAGTDPSFTLMRPSLFKILVVKINASMYNGKKMPSFIIKLGLLT
jgi:hypothetical protein